MGGDGGVIAANRRFLRQSGGAELYGEKALPPSDRERAEIRSKVCSISNEALREPIVTCELGYLYNKDAILTALLDKRVPPAFSHVRGLKDLVEVKFTANSAYAAAASGGARDLNPGEAAVARFACPVTMLEFSGRNPFVVVRTTGWALSDKAMREVGVAGLQEEFGPFTADDVIRLTPNDDERQGLREKMVLRRRQKEEEKREQKERKRARHNEKKSAAVEAAAAGGDVDGAGDSAAAAAATAQANGGAASASEGKSKKRKTAAAAAPRPAPAAAAAGAGGRTGSVVAAAKEAVRTQMEGSSVYSGLFHSGAKEGGKGSGAPASAAALFITTSGQRYSVT